MNETEVLRAIERIERDLARLQAEAAALRAHVTSRPPPAMIVRGGTSEVTRRETLAFAGLGADRAETAPAIVATSMPPVPKATSAPRVQQGALPTETIPPLPPAEFSPRSRRSRDTMPAPPDEGSGVRRPARDDDEGGRYGFVVQARSKGGKPR